MIQATETIFRNDHKHAPFHANDFYRHARALLDGIHSFHLEQGREQFPMFQMFLETKIQ